MLETLDTLTNLGGTIVTVVLFLWYLLKKDAQSKAIAESGHKALAANTAAIAELTTNIALEREALRSVCKATN